uniref:Transcription initiation factor TFIID subunit 15 n=1 Tax=Chenopodium quinoa TaxID=63459 RepID=A0A803LRS0_CHEQI
MTAKVKCGLIVLFLRTGLDAGCFGGILNEYWSLMANYLGKGVPTNGSIYVCNLPEGTDDNMLAEFFGTIGLIKKDKRTGQPKIWLYHDKVTNEPKGDATITYEDPHAAAAAVEWFNNKEFHGNVIGVFIAQSKNKGDAVDAGIPAAAPAAVPGDFIEPIGDVVDLNGAGGRGRGRGDASGKAWQQDGHARAATGPTAGLFGPNDWSCPMCANINWAKRTKCNICNTNKPGISEGGVRGGRAGGYKELDEEELEETKRRRREAAEDDGELYDEFGNLKKKFRAKTHEADTGKVLPGAGRAGWETEEL